MIEIDGSFRKLKADDAKRRRRRLVRRLVVIAGGAAGLVLCVVLLFGTGVLRLRDTGELADGAGPGEKPLDAATFVPAFVDLPGDPLRISISNTPDSADRKKTLPRPNGIPPERAPGNVVVVADTMVAASRRFMATLPSSPQDFAFYQTLRVRSAEPVGVRPTALAPDAVKEPAVAIAEANAEGEDVPGSIAADAPSPRDTTSVALVVDRNDRVTGDQDFFAKVLATRTLASLIVDSGLSSSEADLFEAAMKAMLGKDALDGGDVVAIRGARIGGPGNPLRVVQVSLYNGTSYLGTLVRGDDGTIGTGPDPWVPENLFKYTGEENVSRDGQQYRLLDAIYSTALRNKVPSEVLNQSIALLSRSFDLNAFASEDDKLLLAYSPEAEEATVGGILFVGVQGTGRDIECYAFKTTADADYSCSNGAVSLGAGPRPGAFVVPVNGTLMQTFGTQIDHATGKATRQDGMEWAARPGSPVVAAFAGTVSFAQTTEEGNLLKIMQADGRESLYRPLQSFAAGIAVGSQVKAGDLIGYVGTDAAAAVPYLHFELRIGDKPIDPMRAVETSGSDASAVEALTERIVAIESGGSARAKNPRSSATGLGQFTNDTWLRMIRTYRPDLANSLSMQEILDLRYDPDLSRVMVQNLAREGEAYLKSNGISVTPGRLYLCHFLGAGSAVVVLSSGVATPLSSLLSQQVFSANDFLVGMTAGDVEAWADRLMSGKRAPKVEQTISPEFQMFRLAVLELLADQMAPPSMAAATSV